MRAGRGWVGAAALCLVAAVAATGLTACGGSSTAGTHTTTGTQGTPAATATLTSSTVKTTLPARGDRRHRLAHAVAGGSRARATTAPRGDSRYANAVPRHVSFSLISTQEIHAIGRGAGVVYERGHATGAPFGAGTISMTAHLAASGALVDYTVTAAAGTMRGTASIRFTVVGSELRYEGVARIAHGTGAYRAVRAGALRVSGRGDLGLTHTVLSVRGQAHS